MSEESVETNFRFYPAMIVAALTCVKFQQTHVSGFIEDFRSNERVMSACYKSIRV